MPPSALEDPGADTKRTGATHSDMRKASDLRPAGSSGRASPESQPGPLPMRGQTLHLPTTQSAAQPPPLARVRRDPLRTPGNGGSPSDVAAQPAHPAGQPPAPDDSGEEGPDKEGPDDVGGQKPGGQ